MVRTTVPQWLGGDAMFFSSHWSRDGSVKISKLHINANYITENL